jgi:hypothetical protein
MTNFSCQIVSIYFLHKYLGILCMLLLFAQVKYSYAQIPNLVTVDLSDNPENTYTVTDAQRLADCFPCGDEIPYPDGGTNYSPGTDVCITFEVKLHPMSAGIEITFDGGATPTPSNWGSKL